MKNIINSILLFVFMSSWAQKELPTLNFNLETASVSSQGDKLIVNTGKVERIWKLTNTGLITNAFKNRLTGEVYIENNNELNADWSYYGLIDNNTKGNLINLTASQSNDENFTSEHIEVIAEFEYPSIETSIKYVIWAYPNATGIRTQLFIKGEAEKYIKNSDAKLREDIVFDVVLGKNKNNYAAGEVAERYITTTILDKKSVQLHAKGLDSKKKYKLGFTWWDFEGKGIRQKVRVTSVDGEINKEVVANVKLPDYKNSKDLFETVLVDLPSEALLDGTCRIFFDKIDGEVAKVAEVFIYEETQKIITITNGLAKRVDALRKASPENYSLIGYFDCGEEIQGEKMLATGRVDGLPINTEGTTRTHIGYYNDTQHRNKRETPIIKEATFNESIETEEKVNWSNIIRVDKDGKGVLMVKESHKCANQYGVDTGEFIVTKKGIQNTGTALFPSEINSEEYKWCWASWAIAYVGGQEGSDLALKEFDRLRYPVDPTRDIYLQANTWGSGRNKEASQEANILVELESQADLGIDIQQIDDGWQTKNWLLRTDWYPEGWKNVIKKSEETGVQIGLWAAAMPVTYEALKQQYDTAGFVTYKLDFARLGNHENMDKLIGKVRKFIKYTNHKVRVNWDLTENAPRFGFFWAREYGCIYLENRKPDKPENVVYIPYLVLRDIWHVAKYTNINKFQTSIQNVGMTNRKVSDAYLHNDPYAVAIGLVGTPLFFQETHNYSQESRDQIKPLLATYKKYRDEMYDSYVFAIGSEPNNANWSGFQWYSLEKKSGYLMVFRELNNKEVEQKIPLHFLKNKRLTLTNLETGVSTEKTVGNNGALNFKINNPAGYQFIKYSYE
ncbi:hypothetical protein SAMN05216503_0022 [Polaribacter sp. KT25b]|uniref:hypothetical protein n=1 Tax=Polaribacter sp. KT25b TaxID=1855336 RepID=UPI00087D9D12|nr:hypothetical protein [Polaribacter sp. KT25b]SDR65428.1 hypothetical protein SAMN05216503_0022 [Polaribacter sp. KT25b]